MTEPTLTEFLLARIADDEAWAQARWEPSVARSGPDTAVSIRLRKECEAKRRIVEQCSLSLSRLHPLPLPAGSGRSGEYAVASITLLSLAAIYADHPDYDEAWRP